jgi:hypothetical protein
MSNDQDLPDWLKPGGGSDLHATPELLAVIKETKQANLMFGLLVTRAREDEQWQSVADDLNRMHGQVGKILDVVARDSAWSDISIVDKQLKIGFDWGEWLLNVLASPQGRPTFNLLASSSFRPFTDAWIRFLSVLAHDRDENKARSDAAAARLGMSIPSAGATWGQEIQQLQQQQKDLLSGRRPPGTAG